jgi:hypothetical protein
MAFIDEPFVRIDWDEANQCITAEWKGNAHGSVYRSVLDRSLDLVRKHKASRWLAIMVESSGVISPEDSAWLSGDWFPRLVSAGGRRFAIVLPPKGLAALQLNRIKREIDSSKDDPNAFANQYFDDVAVARAWLNG